MAIIGEFQCHTCGEFKLAPLGLLDMFSVAECADCYRKTHAPVSVTKDRHACSYCTKTFATKKARHNHQYKCPRRY